MATIHYREITIVRYVGGLKTEQTKHVVQKQVLHLHAVILMVFVDGRFEVLTVVLMKIQVF
jgi:hypothetical protein